MERANNEHISIGSAKRLVMIAGRSPSSTYAAAIKQIKKPKSGSNPPKQSTSEAGAPLPQASQETLAPVTSSNSSSTSMNSQTLPDLEKVPDSGPVNSTKADMECEPMSAPKVNSRKDRKNADGYIVPNDRKRARVTSPKKKDTGIAISNSFSPLEEIPLSKKQAVPRATVENSLDPVTPEPTGQRTSEPRGQRSRSAESSRTRKPDSRISKDLTDPKPIASGSLSGMDITTPKHPLNPDKAPSGSRRAPVLKENFKNSTRDIASQSKGEKTGKNDS